MPKSTRTHTDLAHTGRTRTNPGSTSARTRNLYISLAALVPALAGVVAMPLSYLVAVPLWAIGIVTAGVFLARLQGGNRQAEPRSGPGGRIPARPH
ncbi:hypothetical protein [Corynebacterium lizhenjunii]|uniref:hypothetical protein n=1 Tax=Corynebacterium lizhenjunii TaxID=2709394 RepID=UPI0013EB3D5E|nr:hypothetical protein [Corynebacterium lizhenjunii]